jgi:hypothetical protein
LLAADTEPEDQEIENYYTQQHDHDFNGKMAVIIGDCVKSFTATLVLNYRSNQTCALQYVMFPIAKYLCVF